MSSDENLYVVEEILNQRKRKRGLEYLVRWKGYSKLHDSWEPVAAVAHCTQLIQNFLAKKKAKSKSRSRSRGRSGTRSRSNSRGRGQPPKSESAQSRSQSRKATVSASLSVKNKEDSSANLQSPSGGERHQQRLEQKPSADEVDATVGKAFTTREANTWTRKMERKVETVRSTLPETTPVLMVPRSSLVVQQVQNDRLPASKGTSTSGSEKQMWIWSYADYATLAIFIIVSLCVLFYSVNSFSSMVPSSSVLLEKLVETSNMIAEGANHVAIELASAAAAIYEGCCRHTEDILNIFQLFSSSGPEEDQNQSVQQPPKAGEV